MSSYHQLKFFGWTINISTNTGSAGNLTGGEAAQPSQIEFQSQTRPKSLQSLQPPCPCSVHTKRSILTRWEDFISSPRPPATDTDILGYPPSSSWTITNYHMHSTLLQVQLLRPVVARCPLETSRVLVWITTQHGQTSPGQEDAVSRREKSK